MLACALTGAAPELQTPTRPGGEIHRDLGAWKAKAKGAFVEAHLALDIDVKGPADLEQAVRLVAEKLAYLFVAEA
jgi:hypothetical protein